VDELTLFTGLKPPPPDDPAGMLARARTRLDPSLGAPAGRTVAGSGPPARSGPDSGRAIRRSVVRSWTALGPRHRRRRLALGLAAVAVAACAATVVPSVLLGGGMPAYAVTRNPDGTVRVTISDIVDAADAAGLQDALRAEGIPALVWAGSTDQAPADNPDCQAPASNLEPPAIQKAVISDYPTTVPRGSTNMVVTGTAGRGPGWVGYIIQPAAMPHGSVLYISRMFQPVMEIVGDGHHIIAKYSGQAIPEPQLLRHAWLPC
jgi:hypothetical protein